MLVRSNKIDPLRDLNFTRLALRSQRGSAGVIISSVVLISVLGLGAFAADIAHNTTVRSELQSAADAAALAGAKALVDPNTAPNAEQEALDTAANNRADGRSVINDSTGSINVEVDTSDPEELGVVDVTASKTIHNWLSTIFGHPTDVVRVNSKAAASNSVTSIERGLLFPLAVSIDAVPSKSAGGNGGGNNPGNASTTGSTSTGSTSTSTDSTSTSSGSTSTSGSTSDTSSNGNSSKSNGKGSSSSSGGSSSGTSSTSETTSSSSSNGNGNGGNGGGSNNDPYISEKPLKDLTIGDTLYIYLNSQQVKNGAFTSFSVKETNADWLNHVIDQCLNLSEPDPNYTVAETKVGEDIYLMNGVAGQKSLADDPRINALKEKDVLYLPVVEGTPPFNQSRPLIGWVAVKIKSIEINQSGGVVETIQATIVKTAVRGKKGDIPPVQNGDKKDQTTLQTISPSAVRLVNPS